ncbi:MAG: hypothetical protein P8I95_07865 [Alphaproteobacteria bacterium]|nr:hypothetical protein [Alphaproteobacteria bacterium]
MKRLLSRAIPEHEWPVWSLPLIVLLGFFLSGVVVYFVYFGPGLRDLQGVSYSPTQDPARVRVEVGGTLFAVPAHFTRNRQTRSRRELSHAELHALLPDLQPWQPDLAKAFSRSDKDASLIVINLRAGKRNFPEARVFEALYKPYLKGAGAVRKDGLQGFNFLPNSPYANKQIFRALPAGSKEEREKAPLFICDTKQHPSPSCESRFDIGNTAQASFVFKRTHLSDWENIDTRIKDMIRSARASARTQN